MLHGGARPMVDGVAQADVSGLSHKNDFALARSLGDWRDARQASQGVVISPSQRIRGFCGRRHFTFENSEISRLEPHK